MTYNLVKMDLISQLRILSSYNELLAIWTSVPMSLCVPPHHDSDMKTQYHLVRETIQQHKLRTSTESK